MQFLYLFYPHTLFQSRFIIKKVIFFIMAGVSSTLMEMETKEGKSVDCIVVNGRPHVR